MFWPRSAYTFNNYRGGISTSRTDSQDMTASTSEKSEKVYESFQQPEL